MRRRLPDRRRTLTLALDYDGQTYAVALGYDPTGRIHEVFVQGAKVGSGIEGLLDDAAVVLSLALQHGADPAALPRSMGRLGGNGERASVIGAVSDLIASNSAIEAEGQ
jgi:hypothetical protein